METSAQTGTLEPIYNIAVTMIPQNSSPTKCAASAKLLFNECAISFLELQIVKCKNYESLDFIFLTAKLGL